MTQESWLRLCLGLIFLVFFGISARYRYRSEHQGEKISWKEEGWFVMVFLRIFGGLLWVSVLLFLLYPAALSWSSFTLPWSVRWAAFGMTVLMGPCFVWIFRHIGNNITQTVAIRQNHQLITTGPYRWIRHPLYSFGTLYFFSFALAAASWWLCLLGGMAFVMLLIRLPKEEEKLIEAFGQDYLPYKAKTGALFPKF